MGLRIPPALKVLSRMHLPNAYSAAKFLQSFFV